MSEKSESSEQSFAVRFPWGWAVFLSPFVIWFLAISKGFFEVWRTGFCPGAPPDLPPYPCSIPSYLFRMSFGVWALPTVLLIFYSCWGALGTLWFWQRKNEGKIKFSWKVWLYIWLFPVGAWLIAALGIYIFWTLRHF